MKFRPRLPFWFSTVHGQITAIVLLGLLVVIIGGIATVIQYAILAHREFRRAFAAEG